MGGKEDDLEKSKNRKGGKCGKQENEERKEKMQAGVEMKKKVKEIGANELKIKEKKKGGRTLMNEREKEKG